VTVTTMVALSLVGLANAGYSYRLARVAALDVEVREQDMFV